MSFENIKQNTKIAAFLLLMNMPLLAQSQGEKELNMDDLKKLALAKEKEILLEIKEKGQKMTIGSSEAKRFTSVDGREFVVGYDMTGKELWVTVKSDGNSRFMLDRNLDGAVDRLVLDKSDNPTETPFSEMKLFTDMSTLSEEARVESRLEDKAVKVYELGNSSMTAVDFQTGETGLLEGDEAEKLSEKVQNIFLQSIDAISN